MDVRIYLDNAATSFPKPEAVCDAVDRYNRELGAAVGRGAYGPAVDVQRAVDVQVVPLAVDLDDVLARGHFGFLFRSTVLGADQQALSEHFAKAKGDKWAEVGYDIWDTGCPILHDALAKFECRLRHTYEGGDHIIFVGEVIRFEYDPNGRPLVYYRGSYRAMPRGN